MYSKIRHLMFLEKIPAIVCLLACVASVLLGFTVGVVILGRGSYPAIYADAASPDDGMATYQAKAGMDSKSSERGNTDSTPEEGTYTDEYTTHPNMADTDSSQPQDNNGTPYKYVVTAIDGYIVVFHAEIYGGGIKERTNTAVGALPQEDIERLTMGIKVCSDEALVRILQDYGS